MKKINWSQLITVLVVTQLAGVFGSLLSGPARQIYAPLVKPPLSPPGWLFGVVWPVLYLLMGIAAYTVYQMRRTSERQNALAFYWAQLFVNFLWPVLFFRFELYWLSAAVILLLIALVLITTVKFFKIKPAAGYLMIPYLLWLFFAAYLNIGVAVLN